jgi:two-component system cell cycle response regulator
MSIEFSFHELKATERLPSPSGTALAIMQLVQEDNATMQKLVNLVQVDPALTARILSFANSAAFGARRPIATVNDAVVLIGMQSVRNFALSLSLVRKNCASYCSGFDYDVYWAQALAMAVAIAAITVCERTVSPPEAFTLGLLSDIGRLAIATAWPDTYSECLSSSQGDDLLHLERKLFAIDHNQLTLMLLLDWGLPSILLDALKLSFEQPTSEVTRTTRFAKQLAFARQAACYCVADDRYRAVLLPDLQQQAMGHAFDEDACSKLIDNISQQWREWGKLIDIKTDVRVEGSVAKFVGFSDN